MPDDATTLVADRHPEIASLPETRSTDDPSQHRVVIVGGGAGGLELATRLGEARGKRKAASIKVKGAFARLMYRSLYRMHLTAVHGPVKTALDSFTGLITQSTEPRVKLH